MEQLLFPRFVPWCMVLVIVSYFPEDHTVLLRFLALFTTLAITWLLWSGIFDHTLLLMLGIASCLGVVLLTARMKGGDFVSVPMSMWLRLLMYTPWLLWEIVKANIDVTLCVLGIKPISPRIIRVPAMQKTALGQTLYANSITLTPGTISRRPQQSHYGSRPYRRHCRWPFRRQYGQ